MRSVVALTGLIVFSFAAQAFAQPKPIPKSDVAVVDRAPPPVRKSVTTGPLFVSRIPVRDQRTTAPTGEPAGELTGPMNFLVPVTVKYLDPAITRLRVHCNVKSLRDWAALPSTATVGMGATEKPVVDGRYLGTITVPVTPQQGRKVEDMRSYRCEVQFQAGGAWMHAASDAFPVDKETLRAAVQGRIP